MRGARPVLKKHRCSEQVVVSLLAVFWGVCIVLACTFALRIDDAADSRAAEASLRMVRSGSGAEGDDDDGGFFTGLKEPNPLSDLDVVASRPAEPRYARLCAVLNGSAAPSQTLIPRFDARDLAGRAAATQHRDAELPFVLTHLAELSVASEMATPEFVREHLAQTRFKIEQSSSKHLFTYFSKQVAPPHDWAPPQTRFDGSFAEFEARADAADAGAARDEDPLLYLTVSATEGAGTPWIRALLPFLAPNDDAEPDHAWWRRGSAEGGSSSNWFMREPRAFKGINCRIGMRGVAQTAHYDGKRNWISVLRGSKRYVVLPPRACPALELHGRDHPSARHATWDWTDPSLLFARRGTAFCEAPAAETTLAQGEILYLPSYWFHFIVSLDRSFQCNARTGNGDQHRDQIEQCGFGHERAAQAPN